MRKITIRLKNLIGNGPDDETIIHTGDHFVITGRLDGEPSWNIVGRDCSLQASGKFIIDSVEGPRFPGEPDDWTVDESDWNELLDGGLRDEVLLCCDFDGWSLFTGAQDNGMACDIDTPVQFDEEVSP